MSLLTAMGGLLGMRSDADEYMNYIRFLPADRFLFVQSKDYPFNIIKCKPK